MVPNHMSRVAVVAIYPSDSGLTFTVNLLNALIKANCYILVISSARLPKAMSASLLPCCHQLIERASVGRDFGSYRYGLQWIDRFPDRFRNLQTIVLANDSMFYPKSFDREVERMLADPAEWQCLFESYDIQLHAQSFFLVFGRSVFTSPAFRNFWARFRPYSSRVHAIHRGEVGLSRVLCRSGWACKATYTSSRIVSALLEHEEDMDLLWLGELSPSEEWDISRTKLFAAAAALMRNAAPEQEISTTGCLSASAGSDREQQRLMSNKADFRPDILERRKWIHRIGQRCELSNPTHSVALLVNVLFGGPIKRDVCYRGTLDIFQVVQHAAGFDAREREAMERDLVRRGLPASFRGIRRVLWRWGRL